MQKGKEINWPRDYNAKTQKESEDSRRGVDVHSKGLSVVDGWRKYRRWKPKAPSPSERLGGSDPSLYTWKDYRSWAEQVRRNWSEE